MGTYNGVRYSTTASTMYTTIASNNDSQWYYEERMPKKKPKKPEIKDEVLKILMSGYLSQKDIVWFMDKENRSYDNKMISMLNASYGLVPFIYDPVNDSCEHAIPHEQNWNEALITDCIEHYDGDIVRATVIKFALTCLVSDNPLRKLIIVVRSGFGVEKEDIIGLAQLINARQIWEPDQFKGIKDRICIAIR